MSDLVLRERPADGVELLRINRPEAMNALNMPLRLALADIFTELAASTEVRCIVITGNEKAFMAGADLKEMADKGTVEVMGIDALKLWAAIGDCPLPVVAAVNGFALGGGCELAMHTDIIIAGEKAKFGQPEIRVGIMPGGGGTQRLTRAVGKFKAMKMMLTGEPVSGADACAMGLASEVVADDRVLPRALEIASTIAAMPPLSVKRIKETILAGQDTSLAAGLMLERRAFETLFDTEDQAEGMQAFIEKRKPDYKGR